MRNTKRCNSIFCQCNSFNCGERIRVNANCQKQSSYPQVKSYGRCQDTYQPRGYMQNSYYNCDHSYPYESSCGCHSGFDSCCNCMQSEDCGCKK